MPPPARLLQQAMVVLCTPTQALGRILGDIGPPTTRTRGHPHNLVCHAQRSHCMDAFMDFPLPLPMPIRFWSLHGALRCEPVKHHQVLTYPLDFFVHRKADCPTGSRRYARHCPIPNQKRLLLPLRPSRSNSRQVVCMLCNDCNVRKSLACPQV